MLSFIPSPSTHIQIIPFVVNFDDLLDETETDKKGEFEVNGSENELNFLRPYMWITHSCPSQFVGNKVRLFMHSNSGN